MFSYIDPSVRERLVAEGKLVQIDARGRLIDRDVPATGADLAFNVLGPIPLPARLGEVDADLRWYAVVRRTELARVEALAARVRGDGDRAFVSMLAAQMSINSVLIHGDPKAAASPLVRVHSSCLTGDVFGSQRCDCGPQITSALRRICRDPEGGILIYMAGHEGRGIGLWAKAVTYLLQDAGEDTYQANRSLGLPDDSRDFVDAAAILLYFLGNRPIRLLTNNPKKRADLEAHGLTEITAVKHVAGVGAWNRRYLAAKRASGHELTDEDLAGE